MTARSATTERIFEVGVRDNNDSWRQNVKVIYNEVIKREGYNGKRRRRCYNGEKRNHSEIKDDIVTETKLRHGRERVIHITARNCKRAILKAKQLGNDVLWARKVDKAVVGNRRLFGEWLGSVMSVTLPPEKPHSALALDEIAFRRTKRINNKSKKGKNHIDND